MQLWWVELPNNSCVSLFPERLFCLGNASSYVTFFHVSVDEGSYEPNPTLIQIRKTAERTMETAHKMNIVKTKAEADNEPDSD